MKALVLIDPASGRDDDLDELGDRRPHTELVEQGERCVVDGAALRVGEWLVGAA